MSPMCRAGTRWGGGSAGGGARVGAHDKAARIVGADAGRSAAGRRHGRAPHGRIHPRRPPQVRVPGCARSCSSAGAAADARLLDSAFVEAACHPVSTCFGWRYTYLCKRCFKQGRLAQSRVIFWRRFLGRCVYWHQSMAALQVHEVLAVEFQGSVPKAPRFQ